MSRHKRVLWVATGALVAFLVGATAGPRLLLLGRTWTSPQASFSASVVDFGEVPVGVEVPQTVSLTNSGHGVLRIQRLVATCGCTRVRLEKDALAAGESTELLITVLEHRPGEHHLSVAVISNDVARPVSDIAVAYRAAPSPISFEPPLVDFGRVKAESLPVETVCRIWHRSEKIADLTVVANDPWVTASLRAGPDGRVELVSKLNAQSPIGQIDSMLTCRDVVSGTESSVFVRGYVRGEYYSYPSALVLAQGNSEKAETAVVEIRPRSTSASQVRIVRVELSAALRGNVQVSTEEGASPARIAVVASHDESVHGRQIARRLSGQIRLGCRTQTAPQEFSLTVPVELIAW